MREDKDLKISIITPSYNQALFIDETITSVSNQNVTDIEHIVIDGGSTDETVSILKKYSDLNWISEKDKGQADALNKGFKKVTGDIVGWINSDDFYEKNIFKEVKKCFEDPDIMWVVGNLTYVYDQTGELVPDKSLEITFDSLIKNPDILRQQATFFRKEFLEKVGCWNSEFHMVMDFDLWIRLVAIAPPKMINHNWAYFRLHADQKTSPKNLLLQKRELTHILKRESVGMMLIYKLRIKKRWYWFKACIKALLISLGFMNSELDRNNSKA